MARTGRTRMMAPENVQWGEDDSLKTAPEGGRGVPRKERGGASGLLWEQTPDSLGLGWWPKSL